MNIGFSIQAILLAAIGLLGLLTFLAIRLSRNRGALGSSFISFENDADVPSFIADAKGQILYRNLAAQKLNPDNLQTQSVVHCLSQLVADPNAVVFRVESQLEVRKWVTTEINTRAHTVRINARKLPRGQTYWRIDELKIRQGSHEKSEDKLSVSVGRNGAVLSVSDQLIELLEKKPKNLREFMDWPDDSGSGRCRLRTKDGVRPYFQICRDVSVGRKEITFFELSETQIHESNPFDVLPIPILRLDGVGQILSINDSACELLNAPRAVGRSFHDLFEGVGRPLAGWVTEIRERQERSATQFARITSNSGDKFLQINLCLIESTGNSEFMAVLSDATELKTLEAQFVQSQKMQAIGQLAGGVAHDFNNLLTAISGHCDLLLLRHGESDPDFADLDQVRQNANRAAALVGQLLAFSRKQTLQPQPLDLEQSLADHTHLLNRLVGEKTQLILHHGRDLKKISADKRQFEQVIMNLVVNARDAMDGQGKIELSTSMRIYAKSERRDRAFIPAGEYCVITVADQGCGIAADKLQRIFEPFYTSKKTGEGTGLGLSTVYGIVKQSGGFIFVDSVRGVGTTFELLFPIFKGAATVPQVTAPIDKVDAITTRAEGVVLLVEDEAPVRAFASRALKIKGFTVLEAANAEEALEILDDKDLAVDIFVTDVVMPGKDGPSWVSEALKLRPETKVVFVSGYAENRCDELSVDIPNSIFLPKPFSLTQLTSTVARLN